MTRTVVQVLTPQNGSRNSYSISLVEPSLVGGRSPRVIRYDPARGVPASFMGGQVGPQQMGKFLADKLESHSQIRARLGALPGVLAADHEPFFVMLDKGAEDIPWETLYLGDLFLALDQRWPIARIACDTDTAERVRDFQPPVRIMAVLGAAGVGAAPEWRALKNALSNARFPVTLKLFVAEPDLLTSLQAKSDFKSLTVSAESVPPQLELLDRIVEFQPNVIHFFCHGDVGHGFPQLRIATSTSWKNPADDSTVYLEPSNLASSAKAAPLWLVTLNCCRGAAAGSGHGSFAYSLVCCGVPAVLAMREVVAAKTAHAFAQGFYGSFAAMVSQIMATRDPTEVDFSDTLLRPRVEICNAYEGAAVGAQNAGTLREWTLPALYVGMGKFKLRYRPQADAEASKADDEAKAAARITLGILRRVVFGPGTPPEAIKEYEQAKAQLEATLYGQ